MHNKIPQSSTWTNHIIHFMVVEAVDLLRLVVRAVEKLQRNKIKGNKHNRVHEMYDIIICSK